MFGTLVRLQGFVRRGSLAGVGLIAMVLIAACGASRQAARPATNPAPHLSPSARARRLLGQTFAAQRRIHSGVLAVTLALTPSSAGGADPISISLEGPFRNHGDHRLPDADLDISVSANNRTGSLSIVSTGGAGYLTAGNASYRLPAASLRMFESANGSTAAAGLSQLPIQLRTWFVNPRIVGSERVGGVATTRIHATVDARRLVAGLSTLVQTASSLGLSSLVGKLPKQISAAAQRRIAADIRDPYVDLWTGSSDRFLRKLILSFELPAGTGLVGGGSHVVTLTLQYSDLNRPQTIVAPARVHPPAALNSELIALAQQLGTGTKTTTTPNPTRHKHRGPPELTLSPYARCIANAAPDVAKMQSCATLSNGASPPLHQK